MKIKRTLFGLLSVIGLWLFTFSCSYPTAKTGPATDANLCVLWLIGFVSFLGSIVYIIWTLLSKDLKEELKREFE